MLRASLRFISLILTPQVFTQRFHNIASSQFVGPAQIGLWLGSLGLGLFLTYSLSNLFELHAFTHLIPIHKISTNHCKVKIKYRFGFLSFILRQSFSMKPWLSWTQSVDNAGLGLTKICLSPLPKCWDKRHTPTPSLSNIVIELKNLDGDGSHSFGGKSSHGEVALLCDAFGFEWETLHSSSCK